MTDPASIIGMIGVSAILGAYFLNLLGRISQSSYGYLLANTLGATLACISSVMIESLPFTILEGTWALVSFIAFLKKLYKDRVFHTN